MPRAARQAPGGIVYHVLNRAVARLPLFEKPADYAAFLRVVAEALDQCPMRILAFVLMPNHWHFVLWPKADGDLSAFCRWMAHTHSMRWHAHYHTSGTGHIYQGRFKSFPVQGDDHFYTVCRYVERNPLRAKLVARAEHWRWSSLWRRIHGDDQPGALLCPWPLPLPATWVEHVHEAQTEAELEALRQSVQRGRPFGSPLWQKRTAARLDLGHTLRPPGRPKKASSHNTPAP
jgi:REP-associated tyrosine transposase